MWKLFAGLVVTVCGRNSKTMEGWRVAPKHSKDPECKGDFCIQDTDIARCVNAHWRT